MQSSLHGLPHDEQLSKLQDEDQFIDAKNVWITLAAEEVALVQNCFNFLCIIRFLCSFDLVSYGMFFPLPTLQVQILLTEAELSVRFGRQCRSASSPITSLCIDNNVTLQEILERTGSNFLCLKWWLTNHIISRCSKLLKCILTDFSMLQRRH